MLYPIKNRKYWQKLDKLVSLENQVNALRLHDMLGKQNFHGNLKNLFEPIIETIKDGSQDVLKTLTVNSEEDDKALSNLTAGF